MKISVIMPVYLGEYEGRALHPEKKFRRAVNSFLKQTYKNSELIVISDGCEIANRIIQSEFSKPVRENRIKLLKLERHPLFTGAVRQAGINMASGRVFCNLDADDEFAPNHLYNISIAFDPAKHDWAYFNMYRKLDNLSGIEEMVTGTPTLDGLCTANVVWKAGLNVTWNGCDGKQDNKAFNSQLLEKYPNHIKIYGCGYIIHHAVIKKL